MHTTLDRALLAPHSPLYRQPLVYYHVRMRAHFLHMYQWDIHSLIMHVVSIFKDCFIFRLCGMSPRLHDNFSNTIWNFPVSDCFPDNWTASSLIFGNSGCVACLFDGKINFKLLGSWSGKCCSIFSINRNQNWVCHNDRIMIPTCLVVLYFCQCAPIKLNGGNA